MKKLAFVALAVLMILSFVGCDGALHDTPAGNPVDLTGGAVPGDWLDPNWNNTTAWTTADKDAGVYTYEFTTKDTIEATGVGFKILNVSGDWDAGAFSEVDVTVGDAAVTLKKCGKGCGNANILGCKAATKYKLTATANGDGSVSVSVEELGAAPASFYLDGMFLVGAITSWDNTAAANLLLNPTKDGEGNLVYAHTFTTPNSGDMNACKIVQYNDWKEGYGDATIAIDGEYVKLTYNADGDADGEPVNITITGAENNTPYQAYVKTTPAGDVYIRIEKVAQYQMKFVITGLTEDDKAFINGEPWSWSGWPILGWNSNNEATTTAAQANTALQAVANAKGTATFPTTAAIACAFGDTITYSVKPIAISDTQNWTDTDIGAATNPLVLNNDSNVTVSFVVNEAGVYTITINATTNACTVTH